jgi:hypothetical protein
MKKHFGWIALAGMACICGMAYARQAAKDGKTACMENQKQLALGILMYVQDYDERFPVMTTPAHLQNRILPYVKSRSMFKCPETGEEYQGNPALNYQALGEIRSLSSMLMIRDAKPHRTETDTPIWITATANGRVSAQTTEPLLGKPALAPTRVSRIKELRIKIADMRKHRTDVNKWIRDMEAELQRLTRKK